MSWVTDHDRRTLERYSRGEISLSQVCSSVGLTEAEVARWLKDAGLPPPSLGSA
jgi:hypothetical protein